MEMIKCLECKSLIKDDCMLCPDCGAVFFKFDDRFLFSEEKSSANGKIKSKLALVQDRVGKEGEINAGFAHEELSEAPSLLWEWKEKYELGIENIDNQHKQILILINKIFNALKHSSRDKRFIEMVLNTLDAYVKEHFRFEEKLHAATKYPLTQDHKKQHRLFEQKVSSLNEKFTKEFFDLRDVLDFLMGWFLEHTQDSDKQFSKFIVENKSA